MMNDWRWSIVLCEVNCWVKYWNGWGVRFCYNLKRCWFGVDFDFSRVGIYFNFCGFVVNLKM